MTPYKTQRRFPVPLNTQAPGMAWVFFCPPPPPFHPARLAAPPAVPFHRSKKPVYENDENNPVGFLKTEKSQYKDKDKYKDEDKEKDKECGC